MRHEGVAASIFGTSSLSLARAVLVAQVLGLGLVAAGCGGGDTTAAPASPWALQSSLGVYDDGSGRTGLAVLQTLRDETGSGSADAWSVTLRHESGVVLDFTYSSPGVGSHLALWRVDTSPFAGKWDVEARSSSEVVTAVVELASGAGLTPPLPALAADGNSIVWEPVAGAASYLCRVHAGDFVQLESFGDLPACDVSSLPPGAYGASVFALSYAVEGLAADTASSPALPLRFDVSEGRVGFAKTDGSSAAKVLRAAGGAYDNGVGPRSFAVWLSLEEAGGSAVTTDWQVEIVGPNFPPENPLVVSYPASFPRLMAWAVGISAAPGTYTATATSGGDVAVTQFTVGAPAWLSAPTGAIATDGAQGSAQVAWEPVAGAASYLASAYDAVTGALVASQWTPATRTSFAMDTFTAGRSYDVYVAAADADMVSGVVPTQVSVAENVFDYGTFVAR